MGRPYAVWNVPVVLTDPFDGQQVTVYTYPADYRGAAFNQNQRLNAPSDRPDDYHSFEMTLNKRFSRRWNMSTSFWVTKTHEWVSANPVESERRSLSRQRLLDVGSSSGRQLPVSLRTSDVNAHFAGRVGGAGTEDSDVLRRQAEPGHGHTAYGTLWCARGPCRTYYQPAGGEEVQSRRAIRCGPEFLGVQRDQQQRRGFHFLPQRDVRPNHRHPSTPCCAFRGGIQLLTGGFVA